MLSRSRLTLQALFGLLLVFSAIMAMWLRMHADISQAQREFRSAWQTVTPEETAVIFERQYDANQNETGLLITCLARNDNAILLKAENLHGQSAQQPVFTLNPVREKEQNGFVTKCRISWTTNSIVFSNLNSQVEQVKTLPEGQQLQVRSRGSDKWMMHWRQGVSLPVITLYPEDKLGPLPAIHFSLFPKTPDD